MKEYQETYIENLKKIARLADLSGEVPDDATQFLLERSQKLEKAKLLVVENTQLLRTYLMPVLDNIISAEEEEVGIWPNLPAVLRREWSSWICC